MAKAAESENLMVIYLRWRQLMEMTKHKKVPAMAAPCSSVTRSKGSRFKCALKVKTTANPPGPMVMGKVKGKKTFGSSAKIELCTSSSDADLLGSP